MHAKSEKCTKGIIGRFQSVLVALSMLLVCSFTLAAQTQVSGVVTDESGEPLAGVSVLVKGSSVGTSTNIDGEYALNAPAEATLTFSYVGMAPAKYKLASGQTKLNVVMKEDATNLDEVVVVGYGQQKKITMTGAVVQTSAKEITKTVGTNLSQSLVGKLPGMITMQSSGRPGSDAVSILVRGYSSYNDAGTVLVVIDGVERGSDGMTSLDPNEVESISVLKDAASCAIYGMKAANGVIIITTKRGQQGKATINYRGTVTLNKPTALPNMMNGRQYMEWYNLAQTLDGVDPSNVHFTPDMIAAVNNGDISDGIEDTDWLGTMKKTTLNTQHNLTISGGTQNAHYFLSGGFMKQNGTLKGQNYQRGNFRSNVDAHIADMFDLQFNAAGIVADSHYPSGQTYATTYGGYSLENQMLYSAPYIPKTYINGSNPDDPNNGMPTSGFRNTGHNPEYAAGHSGFSESRRVTINTSGRIDWNAPFLKGFKASFFFSWDWYDLQSKTFAYGYRVMSWNPSTKTYANLLSPNLLEEGNMNVGNSKQQQVVIRPSISYDGSFGKHNVNALVLFEQIKTKSSSMGANRRNFPIFDLPYINFGTEVDPRVANVNNESAGYGASQSFAGRVSYNYDEKYLAEVAFRYDGSYHFAPGKRWGFFPSVSAGWVISRENWFKEWTDKIDFLKIRGSIGKTGNDKLESHNYWLFRQQYLMSTGVAAFGTTPATSSTLSPVHTYLQDNLTWEKNNSYDIGFELTMWNGLLGVEFDYFYKYTYDILTGVGSAFAPSLAGNYPTIDNKGNFDNRGIELMLKHTNRVGKVSYNLNANVTWAHNRILSKTESAGVLPWQSRLGSSIGDVWGFKTAGLYQTQEEIDNMPKPIGQTPRLGDIRYVDINGDGKITVEDQVKIARNSRPELMFALNAEANWNGFDLSFQFQGAALADKMLGSGISDMCPLTRPWYGNWDNSPLYLVEGSWRPDNTNAEYPRLSIAGNAQNGYISDFWKRNAAYLRLKNLTIGYTIPTKITKKAGMSNVRFFASGVNLFTITDFKYLDPEGGNYAWAFYPQQRTFTFGLDLSF